MSPATTTPAFEVVDPEFILGLPILLLDRPPAADDPDQRETVLNAISS